MMIERNAPDTEVTPRLIRVFVSSTFRDMHAEREELTKRVFPQLRKVCEGRDLVWGEVDLRWGITEEAKLEGRILPICLEEIRICRPYFICILGERYGWVPEALPLDLIDREPWLGEHRGRSVTELEILHGALNDPRMARYAFFYFRDPAYIETLPPEIQMAWREEATQDEVNIYGHEQAHRRSAERRQRLAELKGRILASGLRCEKYTDPRTLGELVLRDLTAAIDSLFPETAVPDPLVRESVAHDAFARSRAAVEVRPGQMAGVYIEQPGYFSALDTHVAGDGPPLAVVGEPGTGKSALLANWGLRYRIEYPEAFIVMHFIGATPESTDSARMVRRILGELDRRFDLGIEIPDNIDALRATFTNALHAAAGRGRLVFIIDALDQLEDRDQARDLAWLPYAIPVNVRLIVSTLPGRSLEALMKRSWPTLHLRPLARHECHDLIVGYLGQYKKELDSARRERILAKPQVANPLFLRVLLEELRLWGDHDTLDTSIDEYLAAVTLGDLYRKVLRRFERDFERERPGLVREAMSLLWASRWGLSEAELLDLLGSGGEALPHAYWSPLYLAVEASIAVRSGLIGFFHDELRQAVRDTYLATEEARNAAHRRLADLFATQELGPRKVAELPWQLERSQQWPRLREIMVDLPFLSAMWARSRNEVLSYWAQVAEPFSGSIGVSYSGSWKAYHAQGGDLSALSQLLLMTGDTRLGREVIQAHLQQCRAGTDKPSLIRALENMAAMLRIDGERSMAQRIERERAEACQDSGDDRGLASCFGALAQYETGIARLRLLQKQETILTRLGDIAQLQGCLGNQALVKAENGEIEAAAELRREGMRICEALGLRYELQAHLLNHAVLLKSLGQDDEALRLLERSEGDCRLLGLSDNLATSLGQQANILAKGTKTPIAGEERRGGDSLPRRLESARPGHLPVESGRYV